MTHNSTGVSKQKMHELWNNRSRAKSHACSPGKIIEVMGNICQSQLKLVRDQYQQNFVGNKTNLYLYSDIQQWVFQQLHQDSEL